VKGDGRNHLSGAGRRCRALSRAGADCGEAVVRGACEGPGLAVLAMLGGRRAGIAKGGPTQDFDRATTSSERAPGVGRRAAVSESICAPEGGGTSGESALDDFGRQPLRGEARAVSGTSYLNPPQQRGYSRRIRKRRDADALGVWVYAGLPVPEPLAEALVAIPRARRLGPGFGSVGRRCSPGAYGAARLCDGLVVPGGTAPVAFALGARSTVRCVQRRGAPTWRPGMAAAAASAAVTMVPFFTATYANRGAGSERDDPDEAMGPEASSRPGPWRAFRSRGRTVSPTAG